MGLEVLGFGADGALYVAEDMGPWGGYLVAHGPDGSKKWQFGEGSFSLALGADGTIYVAENLSAPGTPSSGALYALMPSGAKKWSFAPGVKAGTRTRVTNPPHVNLNFEVEP